MELTYKVVNRDCHEVGPYRVEVLLYNERLVSSAERFSSIDLAKHEIATLNQLNHSRYVAKKTYPIPVADTIMTTVGGGVAVGGRVVLIEPIVPLKTWLKEKIDLNLWKYNSARSLCIGVGEDLKQICFQFAKALECVHKATIFHGNITKGVGMGEDNKVRIFFFSQDHVTKRNSDLDIARGQMKDLTDFVQVLNSIIDEHPPVNGLEQSKDFVYWFQICNYTTTPQNPGGFRETSKWIYNASIFWKTTRCMVFLDRLNECLDYPNAETLDEEYFLDEFFDWKKKLTETNEATFATCLKHKRGADLYNYNFGIVRFFINYKKHYRKRHKECKTEVETIEFVAQHFPNWLDIMYKEVHRLRCVSLCFGNKSRTLGAILWSEGSVFEMDD